MSIYQEIENFIKKQELVKNEYSKMSETKEHLQTPRLRVKFIDRVKQISDNIHVLTSLIQLIQSYKTNIFDDPKICLKYYSDKVKIRMEVWDEETIKMFDLLSIIIRSFSPLVLWLCKGVEDPDDVIKEMLNSDNFKGLNYNNTGNFNYDSDLGKVFQSKYRYMYNMPSSVINAYMNKEKVSADDELNIKLFQTYSYQARWGNVYYQIITSLIYVDIDTEARALHNTNFSDLSQTPRYGYDLMTLKVIAYMYKQFDNLPYTMNPYNKLMVRTNSNTVWGTCMVPLTFSLLELSKEEKGYNVRSDVLKLIIQDRITAATTSFETVMLDKKGGYTDAMKLVTFNLGKHVKVQHRLGGPMPTLHTCDTCPEFLIVNDEIESISERVKMKDKIFFDWIESQMHYLKTDNHAKNTEHARYLLNVCNIFGNPGIYYKTSLVLEAISSIEPQLQQVLNLPQPAEFFVMDSAYIPLKYRWDTGDEIWSTIKTKYFERLDKVRTTLEKDDFMEWFVSLLTNRSQGAKVTLEMYDPNLIDQNDDRAKLVLSVRQARLAAFTLDIPTYYMLDKFIEKLRTNGVCTTRFQNNRRPRIVEIVPNLDQTAYAIILRVFNELKQHYSGIAVGKQTGGVADMFLQLSYTGHPLGICASSDVTGMDASTQPFVAKIFGQLIAEFILDKISENSNGTYFCFNKSQIQIDTNDGDMFRTKTIPALSLNLLLVMSERLQKKYLLKDDVFGTMVEVNPNIFESGRFDTSAQHTVLLDIIADITLERLKNETKKPVAAEKRKFGDDSFEGFVFSNEDDLKQFTADFIQLEQELLLRTGFKIENSVSRYIGDFLQQLAFNGACVPKSARSSIMTDERGDTRNRDKMAVAKVMSEVIAASSQRCYSQINVCNIFISLWLTIRCVQLYRENLYNTHLLKDQLWGKFSTKLGNRFYFTYPFLVPFISPINYSHPRIEIAEGKLEEVSNLMLVGDIGIIWFLNSSLTASEKLMCTTTFSQPQKFSQRIGRDLYFINVSEIFSEKIQHWQWKGAWIITQYKRDALLSKQRHQLLNEDIERMSNVLQSFYNQQQTMLSYEGWNRLKEQHGIKMPLGITYWAEPMIKVENMFSALTESELEAKDMDSQFVSFLLRNKTINKELSQKVQRLSIFFDFHVNSIISVWPTYGEFPILPGSWTSSDHEKYTKLAGTPFIHQGTVTKVFSGIISQYGKRFDLETAIKIGKQALNKGEGAFSDFIHAINLADNMKSSLRSVIEEEAHLVSDEFYNTGFRPSILFDINGNVEYLKKWMDVLDVATAASIRSLQLIGRDIILISVSHYPSHTITIKPSYQCQLFLERKRVLRRLGLRPL